MAYLDLAQAAPESGEDDVRERNDKRTTHSRARSSVAQRDVEYSSEKQGQCIVVKI